MERLAETRAKAQQLREAVEEARAVLKLDPDNVDAHRLLARIYVRTLGDQSASESQKENLTKAIDEFQAILKIQPDDAYSSLWLARLYRFENRHTDAEKVLRDLLQRDPGNGPALEQLSQLLIDEGRSQEAVKILSDAAGTSSSPEVYDLLGDAYAQAKNYPKSEEAYRKAAESDPDQPGWPMRSWSKTNTPKRSSNSRNFLKSSPAPLKIICGWRSSTAGWQNSIRRSQACCGRSNSRPAAWKFSTTKRCFTKIRAGTKMQSRFFRTRSRA
jgi:tetratricopeptide (TPR) repeat protein